jgi:hypothetical protein
MPVIPALRRLMQNYELKASLGYKVSPVSRNKRKKKWNHTMEHYKCYKSES